MSAGPQKARHNLFGLFVNEVTRPDLATQVSHEHSLFDSDHSQVLRARQDSLASIYHSLVITRE